jgi:hypothetical protein
MRMMLRSIGCLAGIACAAANAAPMNPDPTGMWYDPAQPGWGMSLTQQGETIFAALFVYDANHNPQWFVASNIVDMGGPGNFLNGEIHGGTLYRTNGPTFTMPADTTTLSATPVGTIQISYTQPTNNLVIAYTVNGVTVNKTIGPQTWGSNAPQLVGTFSGSISIASISSCPATPMSLQQVQRMTVQAGATPEAITIFWSTGIDTGCSISGTYAQRGQYGTLSGPVMCGPIPAPMTSVGTFDITQMTISSTGFSGFLNYTQQTPTGSCTVGGSIGGVKN